MISSQHPGTSEDVQEAITEVPVATVDKVDCSGSATATANVPEEYDWSDSLNESDFPGSSQDEEWDRRFRVKVFSCKRVGCQWPCEHHQHRFAKRDHSDILKRTPRYYEEFAMDYGALTRATEEGCAVCALINDIVLAWAHHPLLQTIWKIEMTFRAEAEYWNRAKAHSVPALWIYHAEGYTILLLQSPKGTCL